MSLREIRAESFRLSILIALLNEPSYRMNDSEIRTVCAHFGNTMSADECRSQLAWLERQGLVTTESHTGYTIAKLTSNGQDVAEGIITWPGVKRRRA